MRLESGQLIPICRPRQGPWAMPSAPWAATGGRGEGREQVCAGKLLLGSCAQLVGSSESRER